ncbi:hypothetical protein QC761_404360 [Podospora bellae-mahoneyi]|uniref:Uncharacterized protein n=1 Tax=Podospora bellae-mahoneyi TaxID=2093777 RepID=A0ABR0FLT3_9PEZI|nr:hypothetical protein QC761_404360 [Podospora bellae-mahoneyi]
MLSRWPPLSRCWEMCNLIPEAPQRLNVHSAAGSPRLNGRKSVKAPSYGGTYAAYCQLLSASAVMRTAGTMLTSSVLTAIPRWRARSLRERDPA